MIYLLKMVIFHGKLLVITRGYVLNQLCVAPTMATHTPSISGLLKWWIPSRHLHTSSPESQPSVSATAVLIHENRKRRGVPMCPVGLLRKLKKKVPLQHKLKRKRRIRISKWKLRKLSDTDKPKLLEMVKPSECRMATFMGFWVLIHMDLINVSFLATIPKKLSSTIVQRLVVSTYPSEKWWTSSVGILIPNAYIYIYIYTWKNKIHVPNHQPAVVILSHTGRTDHLKVADKDLITSILVESGGTEKRCVALKEIPHQTTYAKTWPASTHRKMLVFKECQMYTER